LGSGTGHSVNSFAGKPARVTNKAEAAYRRGDPFEKRRKLMAAWTNYCQTRKVVPFGQAAQG
jgi:hypothetical protein